MFEQIVNFLEQNEIVKMLLDGYFVLLIVIVFLRFVFKNKKIVTISLSVIIFLLLTFFVNKIGLVASSFLYNVVIRYLTITLIIIFAPEMRDSIMSIYRHESQTKAKNLNPSQAAKNAIADACFELSMKREGALITIEYHNSLDQYAEHAVILNSEITKELLMTIFFPPSPLHDGAVIIKGNKIRCAGAYYRLSSSIAEKDKTMGSRHRAAKGISEITDSVTIVVSEETGNINIAEGGGLIPIADKQHLLDYLDILIK